jgi:hypothetical protein
VDKLNCVCVPVHIYTFAFYTLGVCACVYIHSHMHMVFLLYVRVRVHSLLNMCLCQLIPHPLRSYHLPLSLPLLKPLLLPPPLPLCVLGYPNQPPSAPKHKATPIPVSPPPGVCLCFVCAHMCRYDGLYVFYTYVCMYLCVLRYLHAVISCR